MRGTTLRCDGIWHAKCYRQHENDHFPVLKAADLDDALLDMDNPGKLVDDPECFKESRSGNFLMCSFQCDCCAFYNMKMRYPAETSTKDQLLLNCIRRANLDAFWSRERSTVSKNRLEMAGFLRSAKTLGIDWPLPERGLFPLGDTTGMGTACAMLVKTLRAGRNADCIQFETARKVCSAVSNFIHTTPFGAGASTIGTSDWGGLFFSERPTNSLWFRQFMLGCHRCMGDVILDRATTLEVVTGCLELLEEEYSSVKPGNQQRLEVCLMAGMLVVGYTAALRGEEIPQIDLGMMQKYWSEGRDYARKPHVPLTLVGRFKQVGGMTKTYIQPLAPVMSSGVQVQLWLGRVIEEYHNMGITSGPMFRTIQEKGQVVRATVSHLDSLFVDILKRLQHRRPDIIGTEVKVNDEYSARRLLQRGATTEAQNRKIPQSVIEINNQWKKHMRSQGVLLSMTMIERYSNATVLVEAIIKFSERM
ncbi:hypothetical protein ACA910_020841 [Epithemia clementina (nom. ined.)]